VAYNDDVHRFYARDLDPSHDGAVLSAEESHHLVRVLRLVRGDDVVVFDGRGHEYRARVTRADRHAASVAIIEALPPSPEPPIAIMLAQAVLKGEKMDGVVRDATMAGVSRIVPLVSERTFAKLSSLVRAHALERWQRVAVASAKQCRRSRLPEIAQPRQFLEWLDTPFPGRRLLLAEPQPGAAAHALRDALGEAPPPAVCCIVGPEGGWTAEERQAAENAGCPPVTLGPMTLRADAAGLVAVSVVNFALENP
jgi:16S rRNA (uracil1498-N3)-methyltransferase